MPVVPFGSKNPPVPRPENRFARAFVLMSALAAIEPASAVEAPWIPDVVDASVRYLPDPAFNHGRLGLDHFVGPDAADEAGGLTAALDNGDTVVAGLVPNFEAVASCNDGTTLCNIGLVHYNAAGARVAWSNPGSIGQFGNEYAIYPGDGGRYQYIRDVKTRPGYIDVLVDEIDTTRGGLGRQDARIVTFRQDGSYLAQWPVFGNAPAAVVDTEDFYGAEMVQIDSGRMIVAATGYDNSGPFLAVTRIAVLGNGALSQDGGWGEPYGGSGSFDQIERYFGPSGYCPSPVAGRCNANVAYAAKQVGFATPTDFYLGASIQIDGDNWDAVAVKISSDTGDLKGEFNGTGWSRAVFDDPGSNLHDIAAGIYVYQDDVYLAAQVSRKCFPGIGLAKLDGSTGAYNTAFAGTGKIVFGGQGDAQLCVSPPGGDVPFAISATGGRIGIAGYSHHGILGFSDLVDPMLAVVDAVDGTLLDFAYHSIVDANGNRYGDGVFYSIYGGTDPSSPFVAAGTGRIESNGNTQSYLVGKFVPTADSLFANGFDAP